MSRVPGELGLRVLFACQYRPSGSFIAYLRGKVSVTQVLLAPWDGGRACQRHVLWTHTHTHTHTHGPFCVNAINDNKRKARLRLVSVRKCELEREHMALHTVHYMCIKRGCLMVI